MANNFEGAAETRDATERRAGSTAETRKEWIAPELRKIDIEEITANGGIFSADGLTSS